MSLPAHADVWAYIDEKGTAHFAAEPNDARYQLFFRGKPPSADNGATGTPRAVTVPTAQPKLIAWFEVAPGFRSVKHLLREAASTHGVDYELLKALIATESGFDAAAVPPRGAVGLMQTGALARPAWMSLRRPWRDAAVGSAGACWTDSSGCF